MGKGELKVKKHKATEEEVSFDPRLSQDKKTFVLVIESSVPMKWWDAVQACYVWAKDEMDQLKVEHNQTEH